MDDYGCYYPDSHSYRGYGPDFTKDPDEVIDFPFSWVLNAGDDAITDSEFLSPDGLTIDSEDIDGTQTNVWVSGGSSGRTYRITNRVTLTSGRVMEQTIRILVRES